MSVSPRPLRWLVVGPFSGSPSGRRVGVAGERFSTVMGTLAPVAEVEVPDRIGASPSRRLSLPLPKLTSFRVTDVVAAIPELHALAQLADRLAKSGADEAASKVEALVGPGRLVDALRPSAASPAPAAPTAGASTVRAPQPSAPEPVHQADAIDAIFAKASIDPDSAQPEVKAGLDAFIGAMRASGSSSRAAPVDRARAASAAATIRDAVHATACDVLAAPEVRRLEVAWRSLRMIVSAAPGADDLGIDLLDATHVGALAVLDAQLGNAGLPTPDAIFFTEPVDDLESLAALAELGARHHVAIAVEISADLAGADPTADVLPDIPPGWAELRMQPSAAWVCAAFNPPALVHEPEPASRVCFGGAAAALGAMAAASVARTAAPGDVLGRSGMLVAPAAHDTHVQGQVLTIPTERFCSVARQRELAARGVTALGGEPGRPELRLAAAPMLGQIAEDPQLPGRILLGRASRLVRAVRDALPANASEADLHHALAEASTNFLPKAGGAGVALQVNIDGDKVALQGSIGATLAGAAFRFTSDV